MAWLCPTPRLCSAARVSRNDVRNAWHKSRHSSHWPTPTLTRTSSETVVGARHAVPALMLGVRLVTGNGKRCPYTGWRDVNGARRAVLPVDRSRGDESAVMLDSARFVRRTGCSYNPLHAAIR